MTNIKTTKIRNRLYTESLAYEIKLTEKYSKMLGLQLFAKLNSPITPEEFLVLDVVCCNPDICQRDLAKLLIKDRANTGRLLESLEKKALIKRIVDVKNNRLIKRIELTKDGQKILEDMMAKVIPVFDRVFESFTDEEIEQAKNVLKKMRDTFKEIVELQI
ncbi:MAG: MarR family winged helix-turn-helix transcriptional regulator [Candidatus Gastranaerophilaceae bacterium]